MLSCVVREMFPSTHKEGKIGTKGHDGKPDQGKYPLPEGLAELTGGLQDDGFPGFTTNSSYKGSIP
ncbi:hypothetical protein ES703_97515 [subsurface metagenome]